MDYLKTNTNDQFLKQMLAKAGILNKHFFILFFSIFWVAEQSESANFPFRAQTSGLFGS